MCPLHLNEDHSEIRFTAMGYHIFVSNDGNNFGSQSSIITHNAECTNCDITKTRCTIKASVVSCVKIVITIIVITIHLSL